MTEIDLELYLSELHSHGVDTEEARKYLEAIISSNALERLPAAQ